MPFDNNDFDPPLDDGSSTDLTTSPPWPAIGRFQQTQIEKKYFEDGATIHFERLPRFPFWAPLFMLNDSLRVLYITNKTIQVSKLSQRRLTADEVNGASEAAANSVRYLPWIHPISIAITSALLWRTRHTFKFPLYQPKQGRFDPNVFPTKRYAIFTGFRAVFAWHASRLLCYFPVILTGSVIFFTSVTETSYEARLLRDPRLKDVVTDMRKNYSKMSRMRQENQGPRQGLPRRSDPDSPQSSQGIAGPQSSYDKYPSESANEMPQEYGRGAFSSQSENNFNGSSPEASGRPSATSSQSYWSRRNQSRTPSSGPQDTAFSNSGSRQSEDESDLFDDDDDASPVPAALRKAEAQQTRDTQGGSAWDRIRQQSQSVSAQWARGDSSGQERGWGQLRQDKTQSPRDSQRKTEDFSYTKRDEDEENKNYEKERAQKDFDALLEAERRGSNKG